VVSLGGRRHIKKKRISRRNCHSLSWGASANFGNCANLSRYSPVAGAGRCATLPENSGGINVSENQSPPLRRYRRCGRRNAVPFAQRLGPSRLAIAEYPDGLQLPGG